MIKCGERALLCSALLRAPPTISDELKINVLKQLTVRSFASLLCSPTSAIGAMCLSLPLFAYLSYVTVP